MTDLEYWFPVILAALIFGGIALAVRSRGNAIVEQAKEMN